MEYRIIHSEGAGIMDLLSKDSLKYNIKEIPKFNKKRVEIIEKALTDGHPTDIACALAQITMEEFNEWIIKVENFKILVEYWRALFLNKIHGDLMKDLSVNKNALVRYVLELKKEAKEKKNKESGDEEIQDELLTILQGMEDDK